MNKNIIETKKLNQEIKKLNIKILTKNPKDFAKEKIKPFYSAVGVNKDSRKVFLKMSLLKGSEFNKNISREIESRKFLKKINSNIKFPHLIDLNNKKIPYWFLSEYLKGELLGSFYDLYVKNPKNINLIVDTLLLMQNIDKKEIQLIKKNKKSYFYKRSFGTYFRMIENCKNIIKKEKSTDAKIDFDKIKKFLKKQSFYFKKNDYVISHGDFTLANMVVPPDRKNIIITDWEHTHLDNCAYDLARLWIQLWRYPAWRRNLLKSFIEKTPRDKRKNFKEIFRGVIITEALTEIVGSLQICDKKYKKPGIINALKVIDLSMLGFNSLLNIK